jgi:hypothetical protein
MLKHLLCALLGHRWYVVRRCHQTLGVVEVCLSACARCHFVVANQRCARCRP